MHEGSGLESQERRCRSYAESREYTVESVFRDHFTGGGDFMQRPAMRELIDYVDANAHRRYVLIFDDLKRFARDTVNHIKLRQALDSRGVRVECPNFTFEDTPEGAFIETILAASGELERKQNRRQVIQKQRARFEEGYWALNSQVPGYVRKNVATGKWILARDEPIATLIQEALEGYAYGRLHDQEAMRVFLEARDFLHVTRKGKKVHPEQVRRLLSRRVLYAGFIEYPKWEVSRRIGKHEQIISTDTLAALERRMQQGLRQPRRSDIEADFPLRGFARCASCNKPLTASWSTGRSKTYAYYRCKEKACAYYGKSISRESFETECADLLRKLEPHDDVFMLAEAVFMDVWQDRDRRIELEKESAGKELYTLKETCDKLAERIINSKHQHAAEVLEQKLSDFREREIRLQEYLQSKGDAVTIGTVWEEMRAYIKSPYKIWTSDDLWDQRTILQIVFDGDLSYHYELGLGTANLSPIYNIFQAIAVNGSHNVEMAGIEPASNENSLDVLQA